MRTVALQTPAAKQAKANMEASGGSTTLAFGTVGVQASSCPRKKPSGAPVLTHNDLVSSLWRKDTPAPSLRSNSRPLSAGAAKHQAVVG